MEMMFSYLVECLHVGMNHLGRVLCCDEWELEVGCRVWDFGIETLRLGFLYNIWKMGICSVWGATSMSCVIHTNDSVLVTHLRDGYLAQAVSPRTFAPVNLIKYVGFSQ